MKWNKLIRDRIPEIIEQAGGQYEVRTLSEEEFEVELKNKLVEEANELAGASDNELLNEMADVLEILKAMAEYKKIAFQTVEEEQVKKREKRGSFTRRLFLLWSKESPSSP